MAKLDNDPDMRYVAIAINRKNKGLRMSGHYQLLQMLRDQGYRLTPQREMVILALHEAEGHLSAEEIYERVRAQNPCVDISTVYRTLDLLHEMGLVGQCQASGQHTRFELTIRSPHHHLTCKRCGRVIDIALEDLQGLEAYLYARYGFKADLTHVLIEGCCAQCVADEQGQHPHCTTSHN